MTGLRQWMRHLYVSLVRLTHGTGRSSRNIGLKDICLATVWCGIIRFSKIPSQANQSSITRGNSVLGCVTSQPMSTVTDMGCRNLKHSMRLWHGSYGPYNPMVIHSRTVYSPKVCWISRVKMFPKPLWTSLGKCGIKWWQDLKTQEESLFWHNHRLNGLIWPKTTRTWSIIYGTNSLLCWYALCIV